MGFSWEFYEILYISYCPVYLLVAISISWNIFCKFAVNLTYFNPLFHFTWKPVIKFTQQINQLVSMSRATLG